MRVNVCVCTCVCVLVRMLRCARACLVYPPPFVYGKGTPTHFFFEVATSQQLWPWRFLLKGFAPYRRSTEAIASLPT